MELTESWPETAGHLDGLTLIDEAIAKPAKEDCLGPARIIHWDHSLVQLSHETRSYIPASVRECGGRARHRANCGLFVEVQHAWVSVDSTLYVWDYSHASPAVLTLPADSAIISVCLCSPPPGLFDGRDGSRPRLLLVVATRLSVSLVGLTWAPSLSAFRSPSAPDTLAPSEGPIALRDWNLSTAGERSKVPPSEAAKGFLQFLPLQGYSAPTDGAIHHCIRSTPEGRIFLLSGAPHLYELLCLSGDGWFRSKCRLVRHFIGLGSSWWPLVPRSGGRTTRHMPAPGRLRLLTCSPRGHVLTCDDLGTLRLCFASDGCASFAPGTVSRGEADATLQELASLSTADLAEQVRAVTQGSLASFSFTHLFCSIGIDGQLRLDAATAAGERLHFVCSVPPAGRAGSSGARYGFWLQHVACCWAPPGGKSPSGISALSATRGGRAACLEEQIEPCSFVPSGLSTQGMAQSAFGATWLRAALRHTGAAAADVAVSVRLDGLWQSSAGSLEDASGNSQVLELQGLLSFDSPVLDIVVEQQAPANCQRFVVLLSDRIEVVTLMQKAALAMHRAPATDAECCTYLMSLATPCGDIGGQRKVKYEWMWSLDDVRYPTFEEQRRTQLLKQKVPRMLLGRWLSGLLRCVAIALQPVWEERLLVQPLIAVPVADSLVSLATGLCSKRRRCSAPLALTIGEVLVKRIVSQLGPVVQFAREGCRSDGDEAQAAGSPLGSVAARSRLYVRRFSSSVPGEVGSACAEATLDDGHAQYESSSAPAQARAKRILGQVLDMMSRTQQVLSLVAILQRHGRLQEVLDSSPLQERPDGKKVQASAATALSLLLVTPLRDLVKSQKSLWPAVQLCTALVQVSSLAPQLGPESNLAAFPGQGAAAMAADAVCRELQEHCPAIFSQVDLSQCTRTSQKQVSTESSGSISGDIFRQYARSSSAAGTSPDDHWAMLAKGMRALAKEDPVGAAELCAEHLLQLPGDDSASAERARSLIGALLDAMRPEPLTEATKAIETLMARTRALSDARGDSQSFLHQTVIDHMLSSPQLHGVLEAMLGTDAADLKSMLQQRAGSSKAAADLLWKYHHRHGQSSHAAAQLQQLAETPDEDCSLEERIKYMLIAKEQQAPAVAQQSDSQLRLEVAQNLQLPLLRELQQLASGTSVASRWREAAERHCKRLQQLRQLRELYEIAAEFGLSHLVLAIASFSGASLTADVAATLWISVFFPSASCPYAPTSDTEVGASPKDLFPLLLLRQQKAFFLSGDSQPLPPWRLRPELMRGRVTALFRELCQVAKPNGSLWDVRCICTLLEFCNCLWLRTFEQMRPSDVSSRFATWGRGGDGAAGCPLVDENRFWVALEILTADPFRFSLPDVVAFYAEMLAHLKTWVNDLQAALPSELRSQKAVLPSEEELHLHLAQVSVAVLGRWIREAEKRGAAEGERCPRQAAEFGGMWMRSAEGLLAGLSLRLNGLQTHGLSRRLLQEVLRLERAGRALCEKSVQSSHTAPSA